MNENETTETENLSVWKKKPEDLTVAENMQMGAVAGLGVAALTIAIPAAIIYGIEGVQALRKKLKDRKKAKLELVEDNDE